MAALAIASVWVQGRRVDVVQPITPAVPSTQPQRPTAELLTPTPSPPIVGAVTPTAGSVPSGARQAAGPTTTQSRVSATSSTIPVTSTPPTSALDLGTYALDLGTYAFAVRALSDPPENLSRSDDVTTPWPINPCTPVTAYPTDRLRLTFASESTAQDTAFVASLATYADPATASEVLAGFSRAVAARGGVGRSTPAVDSGTVQWSTFETSDLGDESAGFLSTSLESADIQPCEGFVAMRVGSAVLVAKVYQSRRVASTDRNARTEQVGRFAGQDLANLQAALLTQD